MITVNTIVDGVSEAIHAEFGEGYEIYTEEVEQGLTPPCFSIAPIKPSISQFLGKRYYMANLVCIYYFPSSKDAKRECFDVQSRLGGCLEYITVSGDPVRGTKMNGEMSGGVLSFFVNYDFFVIKQVESEPEMLTVEQETQMKG